MQPASGIDWGMTAAFVGGVVGVLALAGWLLWRRMRKRYVRPLLWRPTVIVQNTPVVQEPRPQPRRLADPAEEFQYAAEEEPLFGDEVPKAPYRIFSEDPAEELTLPAAGE